MSMTLVYSPGYLPIDVVPPWKAVTHIVMGKARAEENTDRVFRSQKLEIPVPRSIVLLGSQVKVPKHMYRPASPTMENLLLRDEGCQYCGRTTAELRRLGLRVTRDHVMPQSRGGQNTFRNLVVACAPCNNAKGNRTPEEAVMSLLRAPRTPTAWEMVLLREAQRSGHR
jgi:hypothetical protein